MKSPAVDKTRGRCGEITASRERPRRCPARRAFGTVVRPFARLLGQAKSWVAYSALATIVVTTTVAASEGTLRQRLEEISADNGFAIRGLERIDVAAPVESRAEGDLLTRIAALLADYNFVLVEDGKGGVERIVITSRKAPRIAVAPRGSVRTVRRGGSHFVRARLSGARGRSLRVELLVDTGASTLVLPTSMVEPLGFSFSELQPGVAQTANGRVDAYLASLDSVRVGTVTAYDVSVSFVDDERLGGQRLLGMSFLGRYKLTIDDSQNRILLIEQ